MCVYMYATTHLQPYTSLSYVLNNSGSQAALYRYHFSLLDPTL